MAIRFNRTMAFPASPLAAVALALAGSPQSTAWVVTLLGMVLIAFAAAGLTPRLRRVLIEERGDKIWSCR